MIVKWTEYYIRCDICGWENPGLCAQPNRKDARPAYQRAEGFKHINGKDVCKECQKGTTHPAKEGE